KNWKLTIVSDGQAAVDAVSQNHFDLVLMDVQMPEIDGLAATRKIRQLSGERKHPLPIIGMTAYALSGDRERCLAAGMDDYLSKPIKPELFYTVVERHLARSAASDREEAFASSLNQVFDQNLEKNRSLMVDMAKDFLADYPELLKKLHSSVEHEEWRDMERLAHNLKSVVGFFNAEKAYALARDLEFAARDKDLSRIAPVFQALEEELQKVQTKLLEI
ncbi:MAG: response regulator, partial [Desulfuromonadaceae bacterium]